MTTPESGFGAELEPFAGITSFMRLPVTRDLTGVDVAVVGVPYDGGTSYRSGARLGPRRIREASVMLWGYNNALAVKPLDVLKVVDYGDVNVIPPSITESMANIEARADAVLAAGATVLALGGDHSVSLPLMRAHARKFGPLGVVHFDAHPDTWHREFDEQPYSHGTSFRRAIEEKIIDPSRYVQVGLRGPTPEAVDWQWARERGVRAITMDDVAELGLPAVVRMMREALRGPIYVSLDIDAADPAFAPGTGTPEVGGFTSREMLQLVRGLRGVELVGCDLVEVCPPYDHGDITSILAANLAFELLSLMAVRRARRS
ncbi:agmatinase [Sorangium cellulosum]|nr:agmatinase [Sorangium cellulosum]KYF52090.1 agmatinase [Sorangium cellulosum]